MLSYSITMANPKAINKAIIVGAIKIRKKFLSEDEKYSRDTDTQGWTGEIMYPINTLKYVIAKMGGDMALTPYLEK